MSAEGDSHLGCFVRDGVVDIHAEPLEDLERIETGLVLLADTLSG